MNPNSFLYDLPNFEFETGGKITNLLREKGYDESGKVVINSLNAWGWTVEKLVSFLNQSGE